MSMYDVLVYLFFNTLSIHVKLMNEMQIIDDKFKINNNTGGSPEYGGREQDGKIYT